MIDVDDADFLKPGDMPARLRAYCERTGQKSPESQGEFIRCALEGIALKYRYVLEHLEEMSPGIIGSNRFTLSAAERKIVC